MQHDGETECLERGGPQRLKTACVAGADGMAQEAAEKVDFRSAAPKGACDFKEFMSSLKR
jgi:hypothetical protein